jgi:hypothetical protein
MSVINFVHIPKTAGTSFRLGAEEYFGEDAIAYDYGPEAQRTSDTCMKHCYRGTEDRWAFIQECELSDLKMVSGHFRAMKYTPGFGVSNMATFVRDPIQRICSEFKHFVRHQNYKGSFQDFYQRPDMCNKYKKMLNGVPIEAIGFIGLTERYNESLEVFNKVFGTEIKARKDNVGKAEQEDVHEVSEDDLAAIRRLNQQDSVLYKSIVSMFDSRLELHNRGVGFVYGRVAQVTDKKIAGFAWGESKSTPVTVQVEVNGEVVAESVATEFRPNFCRFQVPRAGFVGWSADVQLKTGDHVECKVLGTGQIIGAYMYQPKSA